LGGFLSAFGRQGYAALGRDRSKILEHDRKHSTRPSQVTHDLAASIVPKGEAYQIDLGRDL
jgi:hypothetical protein